MERRRFIARMGQVAAAVGSASFLARNAQASPERLTLSALGDCILTRKVSERRDRAFLDLVELLRGTDCTWANCEMSFLDHRDAHPTPKGRDMNLVCEPWGTDELAWMGVDVVGCANNHTKDYGDEGVRETLHNLRRAGIVAGGSGRDLQEASRPAYVDTPGGRVGQVNCASTFPSWSLAAATTPHSNGRPGLNPLRVDRTTVLASERYEELQRLREAIDDATGQERGEEDETDEERRERLEREEKELDVLGTHFRRGDENDVESQSVRADLDRVVNAVTAARRSSRVVIVTIHAHERYREREVPARFLQPLARACVDAGADAFFGTGPHLLRGVEIYQGKPIFYSLGNFFFQFETVKQIPAEVYAANDLEVDTVDPTLSYDNLADAFDDPVYWESVVPILTFQGEGLAEIALHPITLGFEKARYARGTPVLASREEGQKILERLAELSEPFGTTITERDGVGHLRL